MASKKIIVGNNEGSFEKIACGDIMIDAFGKRIGSSVNGGSSVPISALTGQSIQLFDKPIQIYNAAEVSSTTFGIDLATASGSPLPSNAVRAILYIHNEFLHAFLTAGAKVSDIWVDSYPAGGDFSNFDVNNNFVTKTFLPSLAKLDTSDATIFTAITRSEGANNIGIKLNMPVNSQSFLFIHLLGYTLKEEGSSFLGKTIIHHRERVFQSSAAIEPIQTVDTNINLSIPNGLCALPAGYTHAWLHNILRGGRTSTTSAEALATPQFGPGGNFGAFDPSWFGRTRTSNGAPKEYSQGATSTAQLAGSAPELGYRIIVGADGHVKEQEVHMSGYLIDDDPNSVSGLTYTPANGHFLKTGTFGTGNTSETVDLDLVTLLANTAIPTRAKKAIIRLQTFANRGSGTANETIDAHIDAYPTAGNYTGFETNNNKVSIQEIIGTEDHKLSSGATTFVDLNLLDGTNHIGIKFIKSLNAGLDYWVFIEGFLLDETTSDVANTTTVEFQKNNEPVTTGNKINFSNDFNVDKGLANTANISLVTGFQSAAITPLSAIALGDIIETDLILNGTSDSADQTITIGPDGTKQLVPSRARWILATIELSITGVGVTNFYTKHADGKEITLSVQSNNSSTQIYSEMGWVYVGPNHILKYRTNNGANISGIKIWINGWTTEKDNVGTGGITIQRREPDPAGDIIKSDLDGGAFSGSGSSANFTYDIGPSGTDQVPAEARWALAEVLITPNSTAQAQVKLLMANNQVAIFHSQNKQGEAVSDREAGWVYIGASQLLNYGTFNGLGLSAVQINIIGWASAGQQFQSESALVTARLPLAGRDIAKADLTLDNAFNEITIGPGGTKPTVPLEARWVLLNALVQTNSTSTIVGLGAYHIGTNNLAGLVQTKQSQTTFTEESFWVYIGSGQAIRYKSVDGANINSAGGWWVLGWATEGT